jgi:hypothetical protein
MGALAFRGFSKTTMWDSWLIGREACPLVLESVGVIQAGTRSGIASREVGAMLCNRLLLRWEQSCNRLLSAGRGL